MAPILWMLSFLALLLHHPLLSSAFPTELPTGLAPRDNTLSLDQVLEKTPQYTFWNTGTDGQGQCDAIRWVSLESVLAFHRADVVILLETMMGAILCFIPSSDLEKMAPETPSKDPNYQDLFYDRLLGKDGHLMKSMRQMIAWQAEANSDHLPPPFIVFDMQIAAPDVTTFPVRADVVQRMASDLQDKLKANLDVYHPQPDWRIPIYWLKEGSENTIALYKYHKETEGHFARLWITGAFGAEHHHVADISLEKPTPYSDPNCFHWVQFEVAKIHYRVEGLYHVKGKPLEPAQEDPDKRPDLPQLYTQQDRRYAQNAKWAEYNPHATKIKCDGVPLSPYGSLLGHIMPRATGASSLLMVQTSAFSIICQIPLQDWEDITVLWSKYQNRGSYAEVTEDVYNSERDVLLQNLKLALNEVVKDVADLSVFGAQIMVVHTAKSATTSLFMNNLVPELTTILQEAGRADPMDCALAVKDFLFPIHSVRNSIAEDYMYNVMWQPPLSTDVWIWRQGRHQNAIRVGPANGQSKLPAAKLDLIARPPSYEYYNPRDMPLATVALGRGFWTKCVI